MSSNNNTCYKSDGTESPDIPCGFPNLSTCCGDGWDCLSNGLCRQHGTTAYSQSTCTNPSYENCLAFCNQSQYDGFTEVSRCEPNGNSWCCAGAAGQEFGGPTCCDTNDTTSLEPYPFSAIGSPSDSAVIPTSTSSSITLTNHATNSQGQSVVSPASIPSSLASMSPISLSATSTSVLSGSASIRVSTQSTSQTAFVLPTQISSTASSTSSNSPSPQSANQAHSSKLGIEVGIPVAIFLILLAVLAFFMFQNRKFKQRLIQLRDQMGANSPRQEHARPKMEEFEGDPVAELDLTYFELGHRHAPKHELLGSEIHELNHRGIPRHELAGDSRRR